MYCISPIKQKKSQGPYVACWSCSKKCDPGAWTLCFNPKDPNEQVDICQACLKDYGFAVVR